MSISSCDAPVADTISSSSSKHVSRAIPAGYAVGLHTVPELLRVVEGIGDLELHAREGWRRTIAEAWRGGRKSIESWTWLRLRIEFKGMLGSNVLWRIMADACPMAGSWDRGINPVTWERTQPSTYVKLHHLKNAYSMVHPSQIHANKPLLLVIEELLGQGRIRIYDRAPIIAVIALEVFSIQTASCRGDLPAGNHMEERICHN